MKRRLVLHALVVLFIMTAGIGSSCNRQPPPPKDPNSQEPSPNANNRGNEPRAGENDNPAADADTAMIFKVDKDVSLKTKDAVEFVPILSGLFRRGDLLRVGEQSTAWVTCSDKSVCPLAKGDYTECCRGACENGIRLYPPDEGATRAIMNKTDLPPNELQEIETTEAKIRALGADEIATQFLIANLYSSWKLMEANQEVDKLSQELKDPGAQQKLNRLYLPMLRRTGDMYLKMDNKGLAEEKYKKVVELAPRANDEKEKAAAHVSLGQLYKDTGRKEEALQNLQKSEQLYEKEGDKKKAAEVRRAIVRVQNQ